MNRFRQSFQTRRWFNIVLSWVLLLGHLQLQVHGATEVHRICSEHGTVEHLDSGSAEGPADAHEESESESESEHGTACSGDCLQVAVADSGQSWSISRAVTRGQVPMAERAIPPVRGPPLGFAPKTSPPVFA